MPQGPLARKLPGAHSLRTLLKSERESAFNWRRGSPAASGAVCAHQKGWEAVSLRTLLKSERESAVNWRRGGRVPQEPTARTKRAGGRPSPH